MSADTALFPSARLGEFREIAPDTFAVNAAFWGFPNVVYLLRSGSSWAVVDTGIADTPAASIAPFLADRGGPESIELVLGTHGHLDHIGGNGWVKAHAPHARFALGSLDVGWAEDVDRHYCQLYVYGAPGPWRPDGDTEQLIKAACGEPVAIDHPLVGGEVLTFGEGREIDVLHLGAHTPGQVLYVDRLTGCAFSGDAVQNAGVLSAESGVRDFPMYRTVSDYRRSLQTIRDVRPALLCTAHAGIFTGDAIDGFLDESLTWSSQFETTLEALARELGDFSLEDIVARTGRELPGYALALQVRVAVSEHLAELTSRGALVPRIAAGDKRWAVPVVT